MAQEYLEIRKETLPRGWTYASIGEITTQIDIGFSSGKHNNSKKGIPHLRPMNIDRDGKIDLSNLIYVQIREFDALKKGDVLFNNTNSAELLGKTAHIENNTN